MKCRTIRLRDAPYANPRDTSKTISTYTEETVRSFFRGVVEVDPIFTVYTISLVRERKRYELNLRVPAYSPARIYRVPHFVRHESLRNLEDSDISCGSRWSQVSFSVHKRSLQYELKSYRP